MDTSYIKYKNVREYDIELPFLLSLMFRLNYTRSINIFIKLTVIYL
jgi:hypothetical protein